jgi:MFS transporter, ACS family, hexuronate transporter
LKRWIPAFAMMLVSTISYIDRNTLAILAPTILKQTGLSTEQYGFIVSVFSFAYMAGNPLWGILLDRLGVRRGMLSAVSLWTLASVSHAFAQGFNSFAVARGVLGFGEGATFPGGLRTVMQTLPVESRSRGVAIAYSGGSLGAVITPWIVTPLAAAFGWRGAFWFTGFVGLSWLLMWAILSRRPDLAGVRPHSESAGPGLNPSFADRRLWSFMALYSLGGLPLAFVLYYSAIYWSRVMGKSQADLAYVLWIPPLGWEMGYFVWGWLTDRLPTGTPFFRAQWKQLFVLVIAGLPLAFLTRLPSYPATVALMAFAMFIGAGFIVAAMSYVTRIYSVRNSGVIAGLGAGSWSAVVALFSPVAGRLFDRHEYAIAFALAATLPLAGFVIFSVLNAGLIRGGKPSAV